MGLFDFLFRKRTTAKHPVSKTSAAVDFDETGVTFRRSSGVVESIKWAEMRAVIIRTTADGPLADDVFWVLMGEKSGCVIPSESAGVEALLARLQRLQGFDNEAVIAAMSSTEVREFVCWRFG